MITYNKSGCFLLVQVTFSGENSYVGHTSKKNNMWFTPAQWLTAAHST